MRLLQDPGAQQRVAEWFDRTYRERGLAYLRPARAYPIFLQLLAARPGERLLDVACGPGLLLAAACARGLEPHGVDLSGAAVAMAQAALPGVDVRQGNAEALPFADGSFDLITCLGAMERFLDRGRVLDEMVRVSRPGARLCFLTRNASTLSWRLWRQFLRRREVAGHQDALPLPGWRELFRRHGLVELDVLPDQWPWQRLRAALGQRPPGGGDEPVRRGLLPLRWANEFVFLLQRGPT